jgi:hypothetical protein
MLTRKQLLVLFVLVVLVASFVMRATALVLPDDVHILVRVVSWIPRLVLAWVVGFHSCEIFMNDFVKLKRSIEIVMKDEDEP